MVSSKPSLYSITCHCGASAQTVATYPAWMCDIEICHCRTCRYTTGILCTSFLRLCSPPNSAAGLKAYTTPEGIGRFFCETCGCHVFCRDDECDQDESPRHGTAWSVATGCIVGRADARENAAMGEDSEEEAELHFVRHVNIEGTGDGGLSPLISEMDGRKLEVHQGQGPNTLGHIANSPQTTTSSQQSLDPDRLQGTCHCGRVRFHITRPNEASRLPHSGYSDLIIPFHTQDPRIPNPEDEKWWLRPGGSPSPTKYLAGTCACRSCRLISGFEIQTWAFVPRANIMVHLPGGVERPLDFADLPSGILKSYESSEGVMREFCAGCGATVFWHDKWRPDLMDVSVGLLDAPEGARAEDWLDWCTDRVSFYEETETGRTGDVARAAMGLIESLDRGLRGWGGQMAEAGKASKSLSLAAPRRYDV